MQETLQIQFECPNFGSSSGCAGLKLKYFPKPNAIYTELFPVDRGVCLFIESSRDPLWEQNAVFVVASFGMQRNRHTFRLTTGRCHRFCSPIEQK